MREYPWVEFLADFNAVVTALVANERVNFELSDVVWECMVRVYQGAEAEVKARVMLICVQFLKDNAAALGVTWTFNRQRVDLNFSTTAIAAVYETVGAWALTIHEAIPLLGDVKARLDFHEGRGDRN